MQAAMGGEHGDRSRIGDVSGQDILSLQLPPSDEADLIWLFGQSESDLGLQSNLGPQLDKIRLSAGKNRGTKGGRMVTSATCPDADRRMAAADRYRRVSAIMAKVPPSQQRILLAFYGAQACVSKEQRQRYQSYGVYAGVVLVLATSDAKKEARAHLESDTLDHLRSGSAGMVARQRIEQRLASARNAVSLACRSYRDAKRLVRGGV